MRKSGGGNLAAPFKGFTLAEVLVTLGIIGVVSAMTVPTLMQNHQRKAYVTQLHKVYNIVQQASVQYMTDRNAVNLKEAGLNSEDATANFIKQYFKVVQDCGTDQTPCFAATADYKKISGVTLTKWWWKRHFVLADGTSVAISYIGGTGSSQLIEVCVDINGQKGPNVVGRDFFIMYLYNNGILDDLAGKGNADDDSEVSSSVPLSKEAREARFNNYCNSNSGTNYHGCFGKILNDNWEMTY